MEFLFFVPILGIIFLVALGILAIENIWFVALCIIGFVLAIYLVIWMLSFAFSHFDNDNPIGGLAIIWGFVIVCLIVLIAIFSIID